MHHRTGISTGSVVIVAVVLIAAACAIYVVVSSDIMGRGGSGLSKPFLYKLSTRKIDPALMQYRELLPPIDPGFREPVALAVGPGGKLYVAGDKAIRVFDSSHKAAGKFALPSAPTCLAVADDGRMYVGLGDHVVALSPKGHVEATWTLPSKATFLTSIAAGNGEVYAADFALRVVLRYDRNGKMLGWIGAKNADLGVEGIILPSKHFDVAVGPNGLVWLANTGRLRLEAYKPDGRSEDIWGVQSSTDIAGFTGCCNPSNFAILPDGRFVTGEKGAQRVVKIYSPHGALEAVVTGPGSFKSGLGAVDLAADTDGHIYLIDDASKRVRVFVKKKAER